ncbi:MAG: hypothetical protein EP332_04590 [Bacteroidetes bacterium]|nr:MAG: hypothetical protein EP332_04590 [Bacteroidota bacterium]
MSHSHDLKQIEAEISVESHRLQVYNRIKQILKDGPVVYKSRWFWELLQNAKDAVGLKGTVKVWVNLSDNEICFKHSGAPFLLKEVMQLIVQGSSKSREKEKTGRFGTGFMTTYVLAEQVRIKGLLDDKEQFDFILDRKCADEIEFIRKQDESRERLNQSILPIQSFDDIPYATSFTYYCDPNTFQLALEGMNENLLVIPLVLAFNSKINEFQAIVGGKSNRFEVVDRQPLKSRIENVLCETVTLHIGEVKKEIKITALSEEDLSVVSFHDSDTSFRNLPRLFFAFPLLDSRKLGIQFFINSESFDIRPEREDINLGESEDEAIKNNKDLLERAFEFIPELLLILKEQGVESLHKLIRISSNGIDSWDNEWLRKKKLRLIDSFLEAEIIRSAHWQGEKKLKELVLAKDESEKITNDLHELLRVLYPEATPELEMLKQLTQTIDDYKVLGTSQIEMIWEVERLCEYVERGNILEDSELFQKIPVAEIRWNWLNSFYSILKLKDRKLFSEYAVILNQLGAFVQGANNLRTDGVNDGELLNISTLLKKELRENLIEQKLTTVLNELYPKLTREEVVSNLITSLNKFSEEEYNDRDLRFANARMLKWLIDHKDIDRIKAFQILVLSKSGIIKKTFDTGAKHKLLAPKHKWNVDFPLFAELVRTSDCMHNCYVDFLGNEDFVYLEENNCIVQTPLIKKKERLNKSDLPKLLINKSDIVKFLNEQGEPPEIELNDFVLFTGSDGHIFKNRQSAKGALDILRFVLQEATVNDRDFNQVQTVITGDGIEVQLRKSLWVGRLQEVQWVYYERDASSSEIVETGELPSSHNIAKLIEKVEELKQLIKTPRSAELLGLIGVSVADLIRSLLPNKREQADWDKAFMKLLTAGLSAEDANKMLNDDKTIEEFRKREKNRELIKRNQKLGFGLEAKFKNLVEGFDSRFKVERRPFGSDFVIEDDFVDIVDGQQKELLFGFMNKLIELKVTGRNYAAMTPLQAQTAVDRKEDFILVVLEVINADFSEQSILDNAKAVDDIGYIIQQKFSEYTSYTSSESNLIRDDNKVQIDIGDGGDIRFRVKQEVWRESKSLREYLELLIKPEL